MPSFDVVPALRAGHERCGGRARQPGAGRR